MFLNNKEGWIYKSIQYTTHAKHAEYFEFTLTNVVQVNFRIHQKDKRYSGNDPDSTYDYSKTLFLLVRKEGERLIHIGILF